MGEVIELARRQTGPKTEAGKKRSSRNALKNGLHAKTVVIAGVESEEEFSGLVRDLLAFHNAESDPVVSLALERVASISWRLRRTRRVEAELLSLKAREHVRVSEALQELRNEHEQMVAWEEAAASILYGSGPVGAELLEAVVEGTQHLIDTTDFSGTNVIGEVCFDSERLARIDATGKLVRRRTAHAALEEARKELPEGLRRENLQEFLRMVIAALRARESDQRKLIEKQERKAVETLIGSMRLDWDDDRSLSEAERRLDSQFSRALNDFYATRRAAVEADRSTRDRLRHAQ